METLDKLAMYRMDMYVPKSEEEADELENYVHTQEEVEARERELAEEMNADKNYVCSGCECEISKKEYEEYSGMCWHCLEMFNM